MSYFYLFYINDLMIPAETIVKLYDDAFSEVNLGC